VATQMSTATEAARPPPLHLTWGKNLLTMDRFRCQNHKLFFWYKTKTWKTSKIKWDVENTILFFSHNLEFAFLS
jgi:hypothetical protein